MKIFLPFFLFMIFCNGAFGQKKLGQKKQSADRWAEVVNEGAAVYKEESFDSEIIGYLDGAEGAESAESAEKSKKKIYKISNKIYGGAFYRILLKPDVIGYIADTDVRPVEKENIEKSSEENSEEKPDKKQDKKNEKNEKKMSFENTQYFGLEYANIHFREDTMGMRPSENIGFWGLKVFGPNLLVDGFTVTEMNFLFYPNAPTYYSDATRKSSSGWIFMIDALFQTVFPQNKFTLFYFGFGPLLKYSKFDVELQDSGAKYATRYSLEDIVLGLAFDLGIGIRLNNFAVRAGYQFYWEKLNYSGLGLSIQREF